MLRCPDSLPIGGRLTVEAALDPPPLELPQPPSRTAPPSDAAPARNLRRSSLFVIDPPINGWGRTCGKSECSDNGGRSPDARVTIAWSAAPFAAARRADRGSGGAGGGLRRNGRWTVLAGSSASRAAGRRASAPDRDRQLAEPDRSDP